jgi:hypothetical protein
MSLSAWEQQALESIKNGLAESDPELAALLSTFSRLASDEEMPHREKARAVSRRAFRRLRHARRRSHLRRVRQRLAVRGTTLLLLWLLTTAALIAIALVFTVGGNRGTCREETAAMICVGQAPGHSTGSSSDSTAPDQVSDQGAAGIVGPPSW